MSHRVTLSLTTTNVTLCYTVSLTDDFRRLRRSSCACWLASLRCSTSLPVVDRMPSSRVQRSRSSSNSCSSLAMLWEYGGVRVQGCECVCVRVWVCVWEGCESVSRTNVKLTYWVQTKLRWYHCMCLSTSGFKNVKSSQSESRIQKLCNLIGWHILSETWNSQNLELKQWLSSPIEWINYFYKHFLSN